MADSVVTIYHNPRCSKSRKALELLRENGIEPNIVEYLKTPPDKATLQKITKMLGVKAEQIVRKGENTFKQNFAERSLSEDQWLEALVQYPILIERPIVVKGTRAVLGRPPENALDLL